MSVLAARPRWCEVHQHWKPCEHNTMEGNPLRIYVAGPVTGVHNYASAFILAYTALRNAGHHPVLPVGRTEDERLAQQAVPWTANMRRALRLMLDCECVAVLAGWEASRGARLEVQIAHALDMPVRPVDQWCK